MTEIEIKLEQEAVRHKKTVKEIEHRFLSATLLFMAELIKGLDQAKKMLADKYKNEN